MADSHLQSVLEKLDNQKSQHLNDLKEYLRIPSVSTDPEFEEDVYRCANFLEQKMKTAGLETKIIGNREDGYPLVYGEWCGAVGKPTILFYGHYDVQPADPLDLWDSPPFEPQVNGDELVARGATDDKGQSFAHLMAVTSILNEHGKLPVNVKFLIEGEEESGGSHIDKFVKQDRGDLLACDAVFISDSSMYEKDVPALLYGLKGLCYMELNVKGPNRDLHSGSFGGSVANPLNVLAHIVSKLHDPETGRVTIPGFYDDVVPLAEWEREEFSNLNFNADGYRADLGVRALSGEVGYSTLERVWGRPTCDVNGIFGGYAGEGAKTIVPSWGGAKISMRLVPDQDPETIAKLFEEYVAELAPESVSVEVVAHHGADPVLLETDGAIVDAAMDAMAEVWSRPVKVREGGSIPIVSIFSEVLKVPVILLGFGRSDDRLHSPNEKFNISSFYGGINAVVRFLYNLS